MVGIVIKTLATDSDPGFRSDKDIGWEQVRLVSHHAKASSTGKNILIPSLSSTT